MRFCTSCGHELGVGRFCTNCGHAVARPSTGSATARVGAPAGDDPVADTAERRAARRSAAMEPTAPRTPPSAADTPPAPRFPLFADEVGPDLTTRLTSNGDDTAVATHWRSDTAATERWDTGGGSLLDRFGPPRDDPHGARTPEQAWAALQAAASDDDGADEADAPRRRWPWVVGVLLLVLAVAGIAAWRTTYGDEDTASDPTGAASPGAAATQARDLAAEATVKAPGNAAPAVEASGGTSTFVATNMLDGDPATAWRVAGDARGEKIVFTLPAASTISQVGLVNGYAKIATDPGGRTFDWYHGNRAVLKVAWLFDDGTRVDQTLERNRALQTIAVDAVTTTTLTLRLLAVSEPGTGRAARDFTAISDVSLTGTPAS